MIIILSKRITYECVFLHTFQADQVQSRIGYPSTVKNDTFLNERYKDVSKSYNYEIRFQNKLLIIKLLHYS